MKHTLFLIIALLLAPLGLLPNVSAADPKSPHAWPFTTENGLFHLWLPKDTSAIKGLLVFPYHGTGEQWSISPEVQELAKELSCGIVAFDQLGKLPDGTQLGFPGNDKSPDTQLLDAFAELAKQSGHMEVVNAPLCLFGHSNATAFVSGFGGKHPERVFASSNHPTHETNHETNHPCHSRPAFRCRLRPRSRRTCRSGHSYGRSRQRQSRKD